MIFRPTLVLLSVISLAAAQTVPTSRPALNIPPGFHVVDVAGRHVVVEPMDEAWARKAMESLHPATKPSTSPADLRQHLSDNHDRLIHDLTTDLALPDLKAATGFIDGDLTKEIGTYENLRPPIYYLVTSQSRLLSAVKSGWDNPRYDYNRAADGVNVDTSLGFTVEHPMDPMLLPALYLTDAPEASRSASLTRTAQYTERLVADEIAREAQFAIQVSFMRFVGDNALPKSVKLPPDQQWLPIGLSGALGVKYTSQLTGVPADILYARAIAEPRNYPVKIATLDLLHPADMSSLRPNILPFYIDAIRRKSTIAVWQISKSDPGSIPILLTFLRETPSLTTSALLDRVQSLTHGSITPLLLPAK